MNCTLAFYTVAKVRDKKGNAAPTPRRELIGLRLYRLVPFFPMMTIPVMTLLFPA
jgi:hypothetical protein